MQRRVLTGAMVVAMVSMAGCSSGDESEPDVTSTGSDTADVDDDVLSDADHINIETRHVAFGIVVPEGMAVGALRDPSTNPECGRMTMTFVGGPNLRVEAVPSTCDVAPNQDPGNGDHGTYRTIDDVADPVAPMDVETASGPGIVFEQSYYECTNSCTDYSDTVAIVTLDEPRHRQYPTLVIRSDTGEFDREALAAVAASITEPR